MYNKILDFIESKIEGFVRPEIIIGERFEYRVNSKDICVPGSICTIEDQHWWKNFMMEYLVLEYGLLLSTEQDKYTFSLLHEIGHYVTLKDKPLMIIDYIYTKDMKTLRISISSYEYEKGYRETTLEKMADLWAIEFIETYPEVLELGYALS